MSDEPNEVQVEIRKLLAGLSTQLAESSTNFRGGYGVVHEARRRLALIGPQIVWRKSIGRYTLTLTKRPVVPEEQRAADYYVANYKDPRP